MRLPRSKVVRRVTLQIVNAFCKQSKPSLSVAHQVAYSLIVNSIPVCPRALLSKAYLTFPPRSKKNIPVTLPLIQTKSPTRFSKFRYFLGFGGLRADRPRFSADFENTKWRGKIENFFQTEAGCA